MADSAILSEVISAENRCVYRENVLDEKCFFFLKLGGESCMLNFNLIYMTFADI